MDDPTDPTDPPEPQPETLRLVHDEITARVAGLDAITARLDTKGTTMVGLVATACTFLASQPIGGWWKVPAYVAFAAAGVFGIQCMMPRKYTVAPEPDVLLRRVAHRSESGALSLLAAAKADAFSSARQTHRRKVDSWWRCLIAFGAAVVLMVGALTIAGPAGRALAPSGGTGPPRKISSLSPPERPASTTPVSRR